MAQLVAHHTGSVGVTGSSPVSSTRLNPCQLRLAGICLLCRPCKVFSAFGRGGCVRIPDRLGKARLGSGLRSGGARRWVTGCWWLVMMLDHCGVVGVVVGRTAPGPPCCPSPGPALGHQGPGWRWWTYSPQPCHSTADADAGMRAGPTLGVRWTTTQAVMDQT